MPRYVRDDFESKSSYWRWRVDNHARFEVGGSILRMCMGPTEALYYSNAEIADGVFDDLPWTSAEMSIRVRFTSQHFGSAGFGFWNHSMRIDMSFPVWFIYLRAFPRPRNTVVWVSPLCGFTSFTRTSWGSVEPNATGLPSGDRYLSPMFMAPITSLSRPFSAILIIIFSTLTLLAPLTA